VKQLVFAILAGMLLVLTAEAAAPETASVECYFSDGSIDFAFDYTASDEVITLDRGGMMVKYSVSARVPHGDSVIVVGALPPPTGSAVAFVIGAETHAHFFRDGRLVDEKRCELVR
jgi:negative regulator of sigma E activity